MPGKLEKYLPGVSAEQRALLYGSITTVRAQPRGDPTREGVISGMSTHPPTYSLIYSRLFS